MDQTPHRGHRVLPGAGPLLPPMPLPPELPPDGDDAPDVQYLIEYDDPGDGGPRHLGPFTTQGEATTYAFTKSREGWVGNYCIVPLVRPRD